LSSPLAYAATDNQLGAPDDCAVDDQLGSQDRWMAQSNFAGCAFVSFQNGKGILIPALLMDDFIQELAIDFADGASLC
jgi:hypothetical protein